MINSTLNQSTNTSISKITTILGHSAPFTGNPVIDIYIISLCVALFITIVNKYMSDQIRIKALRKEMKDLQKQMKETMKKDPQKMQEIQKKIMQKNLENMKHSINPKIMLVTMIPVLVVFSFVGKLYGHLGEFFNVFGLTHFGWLGTYITFSIINSIILKKILDVA